MKKSFGISYYGFHGDVRPISSPDGVASVAWPIIQGFKEEGWNTVWMYPDRDAETYAKLGGDLFGGPCRGKRLSVYRCLQQTNGIDLPELDILLHEWRWVIPEKAHDRPDLERQEQVLAHYLRPGSTTKVIIWDGDQKMTASDERRYPRAIIAESALRPKFLTRQRQSLIYCCDPILLAAGQGNIRHPKDCFNDLGYVGNRYERDGDMDAWIAPASKELSTIVYGKWEPAEEVAARWPDVTFYGRIDMRDFTKMMGDSVAVPLLAKPDYHSGGQVTLRAFEALAAGSIPISLSTFLGAHHVTPRVAADADDLVRHVQELKSQTLEERKAEHMRCVILLEKWGYRNFYRRVMEICR